MCAHLFPNLAHSGVARNGKSVLSDCQKWQCICGVARNGKSVCSVIAKVAMYLFLNLAHSGVARNGKSVCSVIAKSGNVRSF